MTSQLKITFLGTGTSQGVPVIACNCKVCQSSNARDKRLRSSVLLQQNGADILIDAGPDFRAQMLRNKQSKLDGILLTHEHTDHIFGLDDVRAFNYKQGRAVDIYAEDRVQEVVKQVYQYAFAQLPYGGIPKMDLHPIENKALSVAGVEILPIRGLHHKLPVFGFRIGNFAYITDINFISEEEMPKLEGLDVLVVGAVRWETHISHYNIAQALALIARVGAKRGYLTHLSHYVGLYDEVSEKLPANVQLAYDGLELIIN